MKAGYDKKLMTSVYRWRDGVIELETLLAQADENNI